MSFHDDHHVYDKLRTMIVQGKLVGGTHLYPGTIAETLGSSTVPVREALIRLAEGGLVDYRKGKGFWVAKPSVDDQCDAIALAQYIYSKDIPAIPGLSFLDRRIAQYVDVVDRACADGTFSEPELSATCLKEFQLLFLPPISVFTLQKLYDLGFTVVRSWTEDNEDRAIDAVLRGRDLIERRAFDALEEMVRTNMEDMIRSVRGAGRAGDPRPVDRAAPRKIG
ncbi:GntR family transcriptional regulator [Jannaschia marina]|uniref:GntR family transcriptional regulator n=1 Tax=Jannaschia marina TaxID=2741674 RepID=UPI0015C936D3|nr:GntR family transcriptional regulator [Jannaschia marina]